MTIDHIISTDHVNNVSELKGYLVLRYYDQGLTWNASDYGDIDMV